TFQGYALGMGPEFNLTVDNTSVNFNIDFGAKSLTGTFTVPINLQNSAQTTLTVSGTLDSSGFTFNGTNGTTGSGNGSFYGSNASSVGGNFNLENNWTYSGVFKAKKTSTP
ncbi:MAG: transferrin-binding protein-like solute binding protein, partial [Arcobacteraceae bacterium]|nr:transferrin-binding protein-like solute binding protein [Arcobacteraceae bacterium]